MSGRPRNRPQRAQTAREGAHVDPPKTSTDGTPTRAVRQVGVHPATRTESRERARARMRGEIRGQTRRERVTPEVG